MRCRAAGAGDGDALQLEHGTGGHALPDHAIRVVRARPGSLAAALLDYRHLRTIWWVPLGIAVVLLALVLDEHFGAKVNGARRWFKLWGMRFQPSEFAKLALLIALAYYGEFYRRQMPQWKRGILFPGVLIGIPVGLIFFEPDVGNALVLAVVSGLVLLVCAYCAVHCWRPQFKKGEHDV